MISITKKDSFKSWVDKTNSLAENQGDLLDLDTSSKSSLISAINELFAEYNSNLFNIVTDTSPELGGDLGLNNSDITGTGDINITGNLTATSISGSSTGTTQSISDESDKLATTAYTNLKISNMAGAVTMSGDVSGTLLNSQINSNVVGSTELDTTVSSSGDLKFISTTGSEQITFINTTDIGAIGGGDITGDKDSLDINQNTIGINELSLVDSLVHHLATTDGSGTLTFKPSVTFSTITPAIGEDTFLINYNIGQIVVYMNGIKLVNGVDFTASNGTEVVLTTPTNVVGTTIDFQRFGI